MNKIIPFIFVVLISSCRKETPNVYEKELQKYLLQDLKITQNQIEYIKTQSGEIDNYYTDDRFKGVLERNKTVEKLFSKFISKTLKETNIKSINANLKKFKEEIKTKYEGKDFLLLIDKLPNKIKNPLQKYRIIRKIKDIELVINKMSIQGFIGGGCHLKTNDTEVLAVRVNNNSVYLFFYSVAVSGRPQFFDNNSLLVSSITNKKGEKQFFEENDEIIKSYLVQTESDTLNLTSVLRTNEKIGLLVSENDSKVIVGKRKFFDKNYISELYDSIYEKRNLKGGGSSSRLRELKEWNKKIK